MWTRSFLALQVLFLASKFNVFILAFQGPQSLKCRIHCPKKVREFFRYSTCSGVLTTRTKTSSLELQARSTSTNKVDVGKGDGESSLDYLKAELTNYLAKRKVAGADEKAQNDVGKTIGGTRGNALLDFISGAPNKAYVIEEAPDILDYSELVKYGFAHLVTPIMNNGGRMAMYDLLELERPAAKSKPKLQAPKIIMDRTGEMDPARYKGLKLSQIVDDDAQAQALELAQRRAKAGETLRPPLVEEGYEQPFASDQSRLRQYRSATAMTPQQLDEYTIRQGKTVDWARRAKAERLVSDRMERLELELPQRFYSMMTGFLIAVAFGKSTPNFLTQVFSVNGDSSLGVLDILKAPAIALLFAAVGSSIYCGIQASQKQRNPVVWTIKGLFGGPLTIRQLTDLSKLTLTQGEVDAAMKKLDKQ